MIGKKSALFWVSPGQVPGRLSRKSCSWPSRLPTIPSHDRHNCKWLNVPNKTKCAWNQCRNEGAQTPTAIQGSVYKSKKAFEFGRNPGEIHSLWWMCARLRSLPEMLEFFETGPTLRYMF